MLSCHLSLPLSSQCFCLLVLFDWFLDCFLIQVVSLVMSGGQELGLQQQIFWIRTPVLPLFAKKTLSKSLGLSLPQFSQL